MQELSETSLESLRKLSNRLYCVTRAMGYEKDTFAGPIASEVMQISIELEDFIEEEEEHIEACKEEMKKFEQGFAYNPTQIKPLCGK